MKIIKMSELSEEEKNKIFEDVNNRINKNQQERQQVIQEEQQSANQAFNNNLQEKNKKITSNQTNQINSSIWSRILGVAQNTGLGAINGIKSLQQTLGRTMSNGLADRYDMFEETNKYLAQSEMKKHPEDAGKIAENLLKKSVWRVSGDDIRQSTQEQYNKIQEQKEKNQIKIQENAEKMNTSAGKYLSGNILPSIGQMAPGFVGGPLGITYFIGSATGNYYDDAKQRGMNENQATAYSGIMGIIEGSLESIGAKLTTNVGKQLLKKNIKGALVNYGLDIGENFLEESIVEPIQEIVAGVTADKADWTDIGKRFWQSGIDGAVTAMITGGTSALIGGMASQNNQTQYTDIKTGEYLDKDSQNWINKAKDIINTNQQSQGNKLIDQETKIAQNGISIQTDLNQQDNPQTQQPNGTLPTKSNINYTYEKSDNTKIDNFRKDASNYWNNTDRTKSLVNTIEKVITDKNYNIRLDDTITNNNGQSVNAQIKTLDNGEVEIKINPNSNRAGEFLLTHEITHAIETQEIKDLIIDHANKNQEFNKALEDLKQTYGTDDVSSEVVADISGQLLGNQEFINNLSMDKPNVFKRIYNKIIELANKITGNSNEALFLKDLKNKWEEAYRTQANNLDNNTYFSERYNNDGTLNSIKINENIFENTQGKSIKKTIKEYLTKHIGEYYNIIESSQKVYLGEDLPNEYAYSEYSKKLPTNKLLAKGRAVTNLQEIIENATNRQWDKNKKAKHNTDAKYGFYKYDTKFSFDINGKEQTYSGTVLIRNDANGKKYLYDILDIKKVGNNLPSVASDSKESSYRDGSNSLPTSSILPTSKKVNSNTKYSMQESENNSGSFNLSKNNQKRLNELKSIDTSNMGFIERGKIKTEIRALEQGYNSIEEYKKAEQEKAEKAKEEYEQRQKAKEEAEKQKNIQLEKDIKESTPFKNAQFEIIQNTNPMLDDYHTGIRSPKDIKTFDEVINDEESFAWGDFSKEDAIQALKKGKITIYSSYPIENGTFVSTSKVQAEDYAGGRGKKVYSKEVPLQEVAWINGDEGQYANTGTKYSKNNKNWQEYLEKNFPSKGTRTNLNEIKQIAPIKKQVEQTKQEKIAPIGENVKKQNKSFEDMAFDAMFDAESNEVESPLKNRDIETIGKQTKVNAYQYDNPKVKPYFQEMAQMIGEDLSYVSNPDNRSTKKGGGTKLGTTTDAIDTLHNKMGYSYNEIAKGLQNIIDDNGSENNAISKKIELIIDEQLRNGYRNALGRNISPNQEYIDTITTKQQAQKTEKILPTKGEVVDWSDIERPQDNKKFRKHYKSIIESSQTTKEAKSISRELMGTDTYVPETNKGQLMQADQRISNSSPEIELQSLLSRAINGEKISSVDIAVGERLIQYFSKTGSKQQLQEAIQATALAGTSAGQTVQALSLLNHQTPQGQATWIQRSVDKMNKELAKKKGGTITTDENGSQIVVNKQGRDITSKVNLFDLTPEMLQKITNSTEENMWKNIDEVYEELGQQVPKSTIEQIDSWRYFSMLANVRTHARNMIGNIAMGKAQDVKNKVAGAIEGVVSKFNPDMERNHTLALADKKTREFSKKDFKNADVQSRLELNENKYNPQSRLQNARKTFKSDALENTLGRLFDLNDNLLEAEDGLGLKSGFIKAMNEYLTANKIDVDKITDAQLNKARNYAIEQAKEATFHQANAIASAINQFQNKNGLTKFAVDAILPFKKTPMNVAKSGIEYSPVQIAKSATIDLYNLKKGEISINQYIDNLSKGLTGTGIAFAGYALAKAGILKASGSDDKDKEKFDEEQGKQSYSITVGGKTYSLDWLAPTGIPLFVGAEFQRLKAQDKSEKTTEKTNDKSKLSEIVRSVANVTNAGATAINPMSEMSMISGLTSVLSSYNKENALGDMMTNAGKSYINQFVPTILGQTAKTTDKYERTTTSTKTGTLEKAVDQTINQIKSKVPGLRQTLPVRTDIWGRDKETEPNLPLRAFNNFINPATVKNISTDKVDKELNKLYDVNGNSSILPDILQKTLTIDNQKYRLTNKEYSDYTKKYGETSYKLINDLILSSGYKSMTQTQKEEAISNIYSYAKESNKIDYANKNGASVEPSTLHTTMEALKKNGGKQSDYLNYLAKTKGVEKEKDKNQVLASSNYNSKSKQIIYENGTGKDDKLYNNVIKKSNMDFNEYLNYKIKESNKEFEADKDEEGKAISGSSKKKYYDYVNKNITGYGNRLLVLGSKYKLTDTERKNLAEYINKNYSKQDLVSVYERLGNNFSVKNGKVYYK